MVSAAARHCGDQQDAASRDRIVPLLRHPSVGEEAQAELPNGIRQALLLQVVDWTKGREEFGGGGGGCVSDIIAHCSNNVT